MSEQVKPPMPSGTALKEVGGFELIAKIGQGGMGAVFKARQKSLDRIVALKLLPPNIAKDKLFIERFVREARASARLNHPHVVGGIDVGQDPATGLWYFAMEFVDGPTVRQVLKERGRLPEDEALKIVRDIAGALECAHQNGMVHRDVKPDNILLSRNGMAKLADLGLARQTKDDASLTQSGVALGTPFYMAPEQVRGEVDQLDTRADLYALGATLYHLVTGQPPFQGETSAVIMAKHLSDPPPMANRACPDVSAGCSRLILKLMQKDKAQRFQTPAELIEQIDRLLKLPAAARGLTTGPRVPIKGAGTTAPRELVRPRVEGGSPAAAPAPNSSMLYVVAGAGGVVLLGVLAFLLFGSGKPAREARVRAAEPAEKPVLTSIAEPKVPPVTAPVPPSQPPAPKESPLQRRWNEAKAFAQAQPQAFDEILRRYHQIAESAARTPLAAEVEAEILEVEQKYDAAAQEAWQAAKLKIDEGFMTGDFDGALAAMESLPPAVARRLKDEIEKKRRSVAEEATKRIQPVLEKASAASAEADPDAGLKLLEGIANVKYRPLASEVQELKARLETERANTDELKARKAALAAQKKLGELLGRFDAALLERKDESAAARVAREAKDSAELEPVRAQADAMSAILEAYEAERKRQGDALEALKGKPFTVGKDQGTIERFENDQLYVRISLDGGRIAATKTVKLADLTDEQRNALFPKAVVTDAMRVGEAVRKLARGQEDLAGATELLEAADRFPLSKHYLELIDSRRAAVLEAEARKAWDELVALTAQPAQKAEQAQAVYDKLVSFSQRYGKTACAAGHADELARMKKKLEDLTCPNLLVNGDFESGTLDGWRLAGLQENPVSADVSTAARSGKGCLHFKSGGMATQTVTVVPGQRYRVSCWVKSNVFVRLSVEGAGRVADNSRQASGPQVREWTEFSMIATPLQPSLQVRLLSWSKQPCDAYFDDVQVSKVGAAGTAAASQNVPDDAVPFGGHHYKFFGQPMAWEAARDFCIQQGGQLICVETAEESRFLSSLVKERTWVGASLADGKWSWVNGTPLNEKIAPMEFTKRPVETFLSWDQTQFLDTEGRALPFVCEWTEKGAKEAPAGAATAQFVAEDRHTQGNWKKLYGKDGYLLAGDESKPPAYAAVQCTGRLNTWEANTKAERALQRARGNERVAAGWYERRDSFHFDIKVSDTLEHSVALYLLDWRQAGYTAKVEILDAASGIVLDTRTVRAFDAGKYLIWKFKGSIRIRLTPAGDSRWVVASGIFFQ